MKQYIPQHSHKLGINNTINNNIVYYLNYQRHGFYYSQFYFKDKKTVYKGYYNMDRDYSHWIENYLEYLYRYYL